jgi:hypothetical protein
MLTHREETTGISNDDDLFAIGVVVIYTAIVFGAGFGLAWVWL